MEGRREGGRVGGWEGGEEREGRVGREGERERWMMVWCHCDTGLPLLP